MKHRFFNSPVLLILLLAAVMVPLTVAVHQPYLQWLKRLTAQGTPAPELSAESSTGYTLGQRHFIGGVERGDTYRWITAVQQIPEKGLWSAATIDNDTLPTGRPDLSPKLYLSWLFVVSKTVQCSTGQSFPLAVETAALWEPVISQLLIALVLTLVFAFRFGPVPVLSLSLLWLWFPSLFAQFIPGSLGPRNFAMGCSMLALLLLIPGHVRGRSKNDHDTSIHPRAALGPWTALPAALALWLDPAFGFPVVCICAVSGISQAFPTASAKSWAGPLTWAVTGAAVSLVAFAIDRNPWDPAFGELRTLHPLYTSAWLGLGVAIICVQFIRLGKSRLRRILPLGILSLFLLFPLVYIQIKHDFPGWLYPGVAMRQVSALQETVVYPHLLNWLTNVTAAEGLFCLLPGLAAIATLLIPLQKKIRVNSGPATPTDGVDWGTLLVVLGVAAMVAVRVRWMSVFVILSLPVITRGCVRKPLQEQWIFLIALCLYFMSLAAWWTQKPATFKRPSGSDQPDIADTRALLYRSFAHWMACHHPDQEVAAMAPPEMSDSLIFHGGCSALMSTAWQSFPGQLAASRLLSAPEASEVEAVLSSLSLTHVILPSWDAVLPLLVQKPTETYKDTLYERLQMWILPPFLHPIPYHLPGTALFDTEKLAIFEVCDAQDEALELSRLAEYFMEMKRIEPAILVAQSLEAAFLDDRNATIARALVYNQTKEFSKFLEELNRLENDVRNDQPTTSWDRRVQRAIVLALGKRWAPAKKEITACMQDATAEAIHALTPLQAHHLNRLASQFKLRFESESLSDLLLAMSSEYHTKQH